MDCVLKCYIIFSNFRGALNSFPRMKLPILYDLYFHFNIPFLEGGEALIFCFTYFKFLTFKSSVSPV